MASKAKGEEDLTDFLSKVDQIENIVKSFKYGDEKQIQSAMAQADDMIAEAKSTKGQITHDDSNDIEADEDLPKTKTGFSKTSINKNPSPETTTMSPGSSPIQAVSGDNFMAAMEADAKERAERKKKNNKEANIIKEKGNEEFRQGNYEQALELYTEALTKVKDNTALWTNRAQTNIKLHNFKDALVDCDWALRVFPNCIKAYIHMGRAHLGLKEYEKARESYQQALTCDPKKENVIKEYLAEVDRVETAECQEAKAKELFDSGDELAQGVVTILEKVNKPEQLPLYYSGGFRMLCGRLLSTDDKTLFRTKGGLDIITQHHCFNRCFSASPRSLSQEELDMLTSGIELLAMACTENETNQEYLLKIEGLPNKLLRFMEVKIKGQGRLMKSACVTLLHRVTLSEIGRSSVIAVFQLPRLLTVLFNLIRTNVNVAITAGSVLNNLALDKKFKVQLRDQIEVDVMPAFESLLKDGCTGQACVLPTCVTTVTNMASDSIIRKKMCERKDFWKSVIDLMTHHKDSLDQPLSIELVEGLLGLIANLTFEPTPYLREFGVNLCKQCLAFCKNHKHYKLIVSRSLCVLSHVLPNSIPSVDWFCENAGAEILLLQAKSEEDQGNVKSAIKGLTACTQISDLARIFVVDHKGLGTLIRLLKSGDDVLVGNSALSLGHCTQIPKVCAALTKTDIIKDLLVLARDTNRPAVQHNCAILIAKLAQGDTRHLERLRELHGIDILHTCMKHLK